MDPVESISCMLWLGLFLNLVFTDVAVTSERAVFHRVNGLGARTRNEACVGSKHFLFFSCACPWDCLNSLVKKTEHEQNPCKEYLRAVFDYPAKA